MAPVLKAGKGPRPEQAGQPRQPDRPARTEHLSAQLSTAHQASPPPSPTDAISAVMVGFTGVVFLQVAAQIWVIGAVTPLTAPAGRLSLKIPSGGR